jgi:hypothetical protein
MEQSEIQHITKLNDSEFKSNEEIDKINLIIDDICNFRYSIESCEVNKYLYFLNCNVYWKDNLTKLDLVGSNDDPNKNQSEKINKLFIYYGKILFGKETLKRREQKKIMNKIINNVTQRNILSINIHNILSINIRDIFKIKYYEYIENIENKIAHEYHKENFKCKAQGTKRPK